MQTNSIPDITSSILKKAKRTISVPFALRLREQEQPLYCDKVIRVIPGKRLVAFGHWNNKPIVAKLFFERGKAKMHSHRDVAGIEALIVENVPTPKLLFQGTDQKQHIHVLVFERIMDSCNLDALWHDKSDIEELTALMHAVTVELATQHVMGIVQHDLHLKNFLVTSKTIYTLDGDSVEHFNRTLSKKESLEHLGLFFSQLGVGAEELKQQLFDTYVKSRGWIVRPADTELLQQTIKKYSTQRWLQYQKKIMRNCTAFDRIEKFTTLVMCDREYETENFIKFMRNPDVYFAQSNSQILKDGRSSTVAKIKIDNRTLVVKRYNVKSVWHWLRRCTRRTRATEGWRISHLLRLMGIPTAKPIAFIEKRFFGLRNKSYLVMEYIDGKHCGEYFTKHCNDEDKISKVAKRILAIFNQLAQLRMTHGDLKMTNIIISHDRPVLIDLDGVREHRNVFSFKRTFNKELQRFMKNWDNFPSVKNIFQKLM